MAKRRKGRKLTKAQRRAISIKNLRKARRARAGASAGAAAPRRRRRRHARAAATAQAPRRRRHRRARAAATAAAPRRRRRRHARAAATASAQAPRRRRRRTRRFTAKARRAAIRNLGKARSARRRAKRAHRKHPVKAFHYFRKPKRVRVRAHRSYEAPRRRRRHRRARASAGAAASRRRHHRGHRRERYVMENPLSGGELLIGVITGSIGYITMDLADRFLATHALTAAAAAGSFTDGANGAQYPGLYNATAVLAPMNWQRWAAGVVGPLVPIFAATMVKAPAGRSALQMFGVGALLRTAGKGLQTLVAQFSNTTSFGNRLYDAEIRAAQLAAGTTPTAPTSGLGRVPRQMGAGRCGGGVKYDMQGNALSNCGPPSQVQMPPMTSVPPPPPPPVPPPPMVTSPQPPPSGGIPTVILPPSPATITPNPYGLTGVPRKLSRLEWANAE
jgi:hypothetical protein